MRQRHRSGTWNRVGHTSHEISHPSSDIPAGVRITRAYLTRHLPPSSFLSSSTVFSSRRIACPISCRRHLWGSKSRSRLTGERPRSSQDPTRRPSPAGSRNTGRRRQPKSAAFERKEAGNGSTDSQPSLRAHSQRRRVTHLEPRKRGPREEGAATSRSCLGPTVTRTRSVVTVDSIHPASETRHHNQVRKPSCSTTPVKPAMQPG